MQAPNTRAGDVLVDMLRDAFQDEDEESIKICEKRGMCGQLCKYISHLTTHTNLTILVLAACVLSLPPRTLPRCSAA